MSAPPDRSGSQGVLERNLRLLFTRSYVPVVPRESFRIALERDFCGRTARRYGARRRRERSGWLRLVPVAAALAAGLLAWIGYLGWTVGLDWREWRDDLLLMDGAVAVRQAGGRWEGRGLEAGAADVSLGRLAAPLEVATPRGIGATLEVGATRLALAPGSRLEMSAEHAARLEAGGLGVTLEPDAVLRVATREGTAQLVGASAELAYAAGPPEHVRVDVAAGVALVDDRSQRRRVDSGESVRLADGVILPEPGPPSVASAGAGRTVVEAAQPPLEPDTAVPEAPALRGTVGVLVRDEAGERVEPLTSFRALLLEEVELPAARMPTVLEVDDEQGRFAFPGPLEGVSYTLFVQADGYALWRREGLELGAGEPVEVAALLERGTTIRGVVLHAQTGEPVPDAVVVSESDAPVRVLPIDAESLEAMGFVRLERTGPDGGFELADLSRGRQVLRASGGGLSVGWTERLELEGAAPFEGVEIALPPAAAVEGVVRDAQGLPREGVALLASCTDFMQPRPCLSYKQALTDAGGRYRIDGLPAGSVAVLLFGDPDEMDGPAAPDLRLALLRAGETMRVDFAPQRTGVRLAGRVLGPAGAPLAARSVWIVPAGSEQSGEAYTSATTRADGSFAFEGLAPGSYGLYVIGRLPPDMNFLAQVDVPASDLEGLELVAGNAALAGRVLVAATLESLTSGQVLLFERPSGRFAAKTLLDEDGRFRFEPLRPGRYDLRVEAHVKGLGVATQEAIVVPDGEPVTGLELLVPASSGR